MSSTIDSHPAINSTSTETERKTYWCHECDMSVSLAPSTSLTPSSDLLCPHCNTHFLELMDSPLSPPHQNPNSLFSTPYLRRFINQNLTASENDEGLGSPAISEHGSHSKGFLDSIPTVMITALGLQEMELDPVGLVCAVCRDPIVFNEHGKQLPCKHLYHADCIVPWLTHHKSCPLCRFKLVSEEEKEDSEVWRIRSQLILGMMRFAEMMEDEEGSEFNELQTTLRHIAARHGLIFPDSDSHTTHMVDEEDEEEEEEQVVSVGGSVDLVEEVSDFVNERGFINLGHSDDVVIESGENVIDDCRVSR